MRKVYESVDSLMFGHIRNLLMNEGIQLFVRNEYLANVKGGIPLNECWYEIWVTNELQYDDAETIIKNALSDEKGAIPHWLCPGCGEKHENQFSACWRCGREKP